MDAGNSSSRREFIKGVGLAGAASVLGSSKAMANAVVPRGMRKGPARNLIFLVADGMGTGTLSYANYWSMRNAGRNLEWIRAYDRGGARRALQETASANSPVTDSAAAASAWGCGQRVANRSINTAADGSVIAPVYTLAREAGKATGLVTTCRITHATPAGFAANVPHRNQEDSIARQYLGREVDVLLGGGRRHFLGEMTEEGTQVSMRDFANNGYHVVQDKAALEAASGAERVLGLFGSDHIPYAIDRANDPALKGVPGLDAMFDAALQSLSLRDNGFLLQVEAGRVDHAGHVNDPAALLREQLEFDRCIARAFAFQERYPDTLVVLTTDHGTGGAQLNGWGPNYAESGPALERVNAFTASFTSIAEHFRAAGRCDPGFFSAKTGIELSGGQVEQINYLMTQPVKYLDSAITDLLEDTLLDRTAVGWTSHNHTAEYVELQAFGPGLESLPAFMRNYELHGLMRTALGI